MKQIKDSNDDDDDDDDGDDDGDDDDDDDLLILLAEFVCHFCLNTKLFSCARWRHCSETAVFSAYVDTLHLVMATLVTL